MDSFWPTFLSPIIVTLHSAQSRQSHGGTLSLTSGIGWVTVKASFLHAPFCLVGNPAKVLFRPAFRNCRVQGSQETLVVLLRACATVPSSQGFGGLSERVVLGLRAVKTSRSSPKIQKARRN